jgi:glutathione S-transferase
MKTPVLWGLLQSPYTERARWALSHHSIDHEYQEHTPFLGEAALRLRVGSRRATVPLLLAGGEKLMDSMAIVSWADEHGSGEPLMWDEEAVGEWVDRVAPALHQIRARVTRRIVVDPDALTEAAAGSVPRLLARRVRNVAAKGAWHLSKKHGFAMTDEESDHEVAVMREVLDAIRAQLDGSETMLARFSAVDVVCAALLQGIAAVDHPAWSLPPATARAWSEPELADDYADLLAWRDRVYAARR